MSEKTIKETEQSGKVTESGTSNGAAAEPQSERKKIDWFLTIVPFVGVLVLSIIFFVFPDDSANIMEKIRVVVGDDMGIFFAVIAFGSFLATLFIAFSKFGKIKLGKETDKPAYSSFKWGAMIFTSTMAADVLFYSIIEWAMYTKETRVEQLGDVDLWSSTFPLFHWGPLAWSFYIVLACAFGFMLHIRKKHKQKFSEACRPILKKHTDGPLGKIIDLVAIFALIAGTATSFSVATPMLSKAVSRITGFSDTAGLGVGILITIAFIYTLTVWFGMKGISKLASICTYLFLGLLLFFLCFGGEARYILEQGFEAIGNLGQNFLGMSTYVDPLRETSFPQNWSFYYWALWMVYCTATPFFLGMISKGRTLKNVVLGGYGWGLAGTFCSFIILGNYGMAQELKHGVDISNFIYNGGSYSDAIMKIFDTIPLPIFGLILLCITMMLFYATTFDSITMVVSSYSYKELPVDAEPSKKVRTYWSVVFILFPIALIFAENSLYSLQCVSIIAALPIGLVIILIVASFFKDANDFLKVRKKKGEESFPNISGLVETGEPVKEEA